MENQNGSERTSRPLEYFNRALIEMGVNTGIVLALVFALFLSRAARKSRADAKAKTGKDS